MPHQINFGHAARMKSKLTTPEPASSNRNIQKRRQTDALFQPLPSYEQLAARRTSKGIFGLLRRSKSDDKLDQIPEHVVEFRKKCPRGVATVDDFPKMNPEEPPKRFDLNVGFDAFYDSCTFSVEAQNFGNWPMAPKRVSFFFILINFFKLLYFQKNKKINIF